MLPTPSESPTASDLPVAANVIGGKTAKTFLRRLNREYLRQQIVVGPMDYSLLIPGRELISRLA